MLYAVDHDRLVRPRQDRDRAACPGCRAPVMARAVGSAIVRRHWAHFGDGSCEYGEGGRESEKHYGWKLLAQQYGCDVEVWQDGRRADAVTPGGRALEFQFRSIDRHTARAREKAHRSGWWVTTATVRDGLVLPGGWVYGGNPEWGVVFDVGTGDDPGPVVVSRADRGISHRLDAEEFLEAAIGEDLEALRPRLSEPLLRALAGFYGRPVDVHGRPLRAEGA